MKFRSLVNCASVCIAYVSMILMSTAVAAADTYKTVVKGQAGQNQFENITDAELPDITGNATYSAYLPLEQTKTIEYLVVEIDGLNNTVYENLAVTVDKIRIDGSEIEMTSSPSVDTQCVDEDFNGTRIYVTDEDGYSFLPVKTSVNESIEIIFTVSGMTENGPDFIDKHGVQSDTTEPSTDSSESTSETSVTTTTPKTSGAEAVTHESTESTTETTSTTASSSVTYTTLWSNTTTVSSYAGFSLITTQQTGTAPLTGRKGVTMAFVGLAVTSGAAIASKIKRKKNQ